jgi:20S proteasome subunit beta 1
MFRENMSYVEARNFAVEAVSLAIARDGSSGGGVRLMNITKDGFKRDIVNYD